MQTEKEILLTIIAASGDCFGLIQDNSIIISCEGCPLDSKEKRSCLGYDKSLSVEGIFQNRKNIALQMYVKKYGDITDLFGACL